MKAKTEPQKLQIRISIDLAPEACDVAQIKPFFLLA